ncbi:MAG: 30S ribosomal protein S6 [Candidatus Staskawiczbacteria bacterium]|nr:30S ribosomal protein S6 [Candidatus Staskawiczbacteria bacterium]
MKTYELTYIISPEITSEEVGAKAKEIESAISSREGTILKQLNPLAKTLSYPIKKHASGFFGVLEFQLEPEKLIELKGIIEKDKKFVRHIITIKEAAEMKKDKRRLASSPRLKAVAPFEIERKTEKTTSEDKPASAPKGFGEAKEKVELKDIEHELDEILGE